MKRIVIALLLPSFAFAASGKRVGVNPGANGDATTVLPSGATTRKTLPALLGRVYDITTFGATPDDGTDDSAAITDALDAARLAGGGTVLVPKGLFIVAPPGAATHIGIGTNVTLAGLGRESVLKVVDGAGTYRTIFGNYPDLSTWVYNVTVRDLKIDQNCVNKGGDISTNVADSGALIFFFSLFDNLRIENVDFDPVCGINTISASGTGSTNVWVVNNRFHFDQATTTTQPGYDNTAVYLSATGMWALGNKFESTIADRAWGSIEIHHAQGVASGNVSSGYASCVRAVTPASGPDVPSNGFVITDNVCIDTGDAINLWSVTGYVLRDTVIANNVITVANAQRAAAYGALSASGITTHWDAVSGDLEGEVDGLRIENNIVRMERQNGVASPSTEQAIGLQQEGSVRNAVVASNTVIDAPDGGIRAQAHLAGATLDRISIRDNRIIDAGNDTAGGGYRVGIIVGGSMKNIFIERNEIFDTGATLLGSKSISVLATSPGKIVIADNIVVDEDAASDLTLELSDHTVLNGFLYGNLLGGIYRTAPFAYDAGDHVTDLPAVVAQDEYVITPSDGTAWYLISPYNGSFGQRFRVTVVNTTGGALGALGWGNKFKAGAWVNPATGFRRSIDFQFNGVSWVEVGRSTVDIPN